MSAIQKSTLFPAVLATEMFNKVKGHSSLAKMSASQPIPFCGKDVFVFDFSSDVSVVGESAAKPAGDAAITTVQIRPLKIVYQSRVSDEFMYAAEETKLQYLQDFADGFAKKLGRGLDVMAMHGVNPATGTSSSLIGNNHLDYVIPSANKIVYGHDSSAVDTNIEEAIAKVVDAENDCNGVIVAPAVRSALAALTTSGSYAKYPQFAFGACPENLGANKFDANSSVSANSNAARVYVGDFANAFRWGFAKEMPLEVIEYGNPDGGTYDLKQANQVLLRSEAYIGWGILDANSFAKVYVSE